MTPNYKAIVAHCQANSKVSETIVDQWLIYYAAAQDKVDKLFKKQLKRYSGASSELPDKDINMLISQFIGHSVFKKGGLIGKYLNHSQVKQRPAEEYGFLQYQAEHPWKFAFTVILDNPAENFFMMEDVFTGETYLLYSPSTTWTIKERGKILLWFNLIGFNGQCWQTFGPVVGYNSFDADDIFFFATELSDGVIDEETLIANLESNPIPYMMLLSGAAYPVTFHKEEELVQALTVYDAVALTMEGIEKSFEVEYTQGVYQLTQIGWGEFPYFNKAYYNELDKELVLQSTTDIGFRNLTRAMAKYGVEADDDPNIRVHMSMLTTVKKILGVEIILNEYEEYFREAAQPSVGQTEGINQLNDLIGMLLPALNAGQKPDIEAAAKKAGVDPETAREVVKMFQEQIGNRRR
nr:hypothetical protein [Cytophagales bacterium]